MIPWSESARYVACVQAYIEAQSKRTFLDKLPAHYEKRLSADEFLTVSFRPSECGTDARTLSYTHWNVGIPLEVRVNENLRYARIIIKCATLILPDYRFFAGEAGVGIYVYDRLLQTTRPRDICKELEILKNHCLKGGEERHDLT